VVAIEDRLSSLTKQVIQKKVTMKVPNKASKLPLEIPLGTEDDLGNIEYKTKS